jgi:hypothetical protein
MVGSLLIDYQKFMRLVPPTMPKKDLASRVFNNVYFGIVWALFLAVVLRLVWPLRDALLICWVYGRNAYFQQGIRVVKEKPTIFSNGARAPDLPNLVTGFGVFLITVLGLSMLLVLVLRVYEKHFAGKVHGMARKVRILPILRDVVFVLVLLELGPVLAGISSGRPVHEYPHYTADDFIAALLLGILGFTVSGCFACFHRWSHLAAVAIGAGFFCFLKAVFIGDNVFAGIFAMAVMAALMAIGGALSYLFKSDNRPSN